MTEVQSKIEASQKAVLESVANIPGVVVLPAEQAQALVDAHVEHQGFMARVDAAVNAVVASFAAEGAEVEAKVKSIWEKALEATGFAPDDTSKALSHNPEGDSFIVDQAALQAHLQQAALDQVTANLATLTKAGATAQAVAEVAPDDVPVAPDATDAAKDATGAIQG